MGTEYIGGALGNHYIRGTLGKEYIGGTLGNEYIGGTYRFIFLKIYLLFNLLAPPHHRRNIGK